MNQMPGGDPTVNANPDAIMAQDPRIQALLLQQARQQEAAQAMAAMQGGARAMQPSPDLPIPSGGVPQPTALPPGPVTGDALAKLQAAREAQNQAGAPPTALATAVPPGAAAMQGTGAPQLIPYGSGAPATTRPAGLSPADKDYGSAILGGQSDQAEHARAAIEEQRNVAKAAADNADSLALDTKLATQKFNQDAQESEKHRAELAASTKERQEKIDAQLAALESKGIDPNHYWNSQGTASKIAAAVAIGLGAFAAHPLGPRGAASENVALGIINNAISQDIESQKVNLVHGLEVAKMQGALNTEGFDHQSALLHAERDSIQTAYTVATNDITKRASIYQGSADIQQKSAAMISGLQTSMDERVGRVNEELYKLKKAAERPVTVGGAGNEPSRKELADATKDMLKMQAESGKPTDIATAQNDAYKLLTGRNRQPGAAEGTYTKAAKGANQKGAAAEAARQNILQAVGELERLNKQAGVTGLWSPTAKARAQSLQTTIALEYNRAHDINRVGAEAEQHRLAEHIVPNLTDAGVPGARQGKLDLLKEEFGKPLASGAESKAEDDKTDLTEY